MNIKCDGLTIEKLKGLLESIEKGWVEVDSKRRTLHITGVKLVGNTLVLEAN